MPPLPGQGSLSAPTVATDVTREALPYRLRQQSLLGEFGRSAMQTRDIGQILQRATELCAQGLETPFAKVLEYMPDDKRLLVRAGIGWASGTIGQVSLGVDLESPACVDAVDDEQIATLTDGLGPAVITDRSPLVPGCGGKPAHHRHFPP